MITGNFLKLCEDNKSQLGEIYMQESVQTSLYSMNDQLLDASCGTESGAQVRVNIGGGVGVSIKDRSRTLDIVNAAREAIKMAKASVINFDALDTSDTKEANLYSPVVAKKYSKPKIDPENYSLTEKTNILKDINEKLRAHLPNLDRIYCEYEERKVKEQYSNTEGRDIESAFCRIFVQAFVQTGDGMKTSSISGSIGGVGGLELLETDHGVDHLVEEIRTKIALSKERRPCPSGRYTVVLNQEVTGLLIHEILGHVLEASVPTGQNFKAILPRSQLEEGPAVIDDPTIQGAYGSYPYDAEGTPTKKNVLISKGSLVTCLHSRETAAYFDSVSTGNARIHTYRDLPIVRMSNTFIEPAEWTLAELMDVNEGLYITGIDFGEVIKEEGIFSLLLNNVFLIEKGELTGIAPQGMQFSGRIDELFRFEAIGKDLQLFPGRCWKDGQRIDVGYGSPHVRMRSLYVHHIGDFNGH